MPYSDQPTVTASGVEIPLLGFGTWQLEADDARRMVREALRIGYRHIDTAWIYKNEKAVGDGIADAMAEGIVTRGDIFVTTKIWVEHFQHDALLRQAEESALSLGLTPDLLLLHWPNEAVSLAEQIGALNTVRQAGKVRHIGVSNFSTALMAEAVKLSDAPIVTNQIEYHPYIDQDVVIAAAKAAGMLVTGYYGMADGKVFDDPVLKEIAAGRGKSVAQVVLRWLVQQQGVVALSKTVSEARVE
ncbi:MAG TPA: hypothetical protein DIV82_05680, partial [Brevundimonas diminuta]|nr:hypothetical protein [Brevundimonas diminuta]